MVPMVVKVIYIPMEVAIIMVKMGAMVINIQMEVAIIMTPMVEVYVMMRTIALDIAVKPMMMLA